MISATRKEHAVSARTSSLFTAMWPQLALRKGCDANLSRQPPLDPTALQELSINSQLNSTFTVKVYPLKTTQKKNTRSALKSYM